MTDIVEFVLARLLEDEAAAYDRVDAEVQNLRSDGLPDITHDDLLTMEESDSWRRPLREVEAKQGIVKMALFAQSITEDVNPEDPSHRIHDNGYRLGQWHAYKAVLRSLASIYSDHPDFDPDWLNTYV